MIWGGGGSPQPHMIYTHHPGSAQMNWQGQYTLRPSRPSTPSQPIPVFAPPHETIGRTFSPGPKNLAHPLHPVYDDGKGGGWKWWG